MNRDYYLSKLFEGYYPNPVFAEISTGNWVYALANTIENVHGTTIEQWKDSLQNSFSTIQNCGDFALLSQAMRSLSQGMSLCLSFEDRKNQDFKPWNTVGMISDFYYQLTNVFDVILMAQTNSLTDTHAKRISLFGGLCQNFPHPFNMISSFDATTGWTSQKLITKDFFKFTFPTLNFSTNNSSEGLINKWHNTMDSNLSRDILLGYLRGTTGYLWELKCDEYKKNAGVTSFRKQVDKNNINPKILKIQTNFLNCLFRYRTKAHYRDFIYLTWDQFEESIHKRNTYIDSKFVNSMFLISNFAICVTLRFLKAKIGSDNSKKLLAVLDDKLKPHIKPWDGFL
jgi:hypothetical protein